MAGTLRLAACFALSLLAISSSAAAARAQEEAAPPQEAPAPEQPADAESKPAASDLDDMSIPLQQYKDPDGRYSFAAPVNWGRLATSSRDEVTFQGPTGDNIRISVAPLAVDKQAFARTYVDDYMKVLAQTFADVKYVGERRIELSRRPAVDHVFTATYRGAPVTCHQVLLLGNDKVLYVTFAGFGRTRAQSEQLFLTALASFWVSPSLGMTSMSGLEDPNAPGFVIAIPEGWVEHEKPNGNSYVFRPPNSRPTSAFVGASVTKAAPGYPFSAVDDAFLAAYAQQIVATHPPETVEMRAMRRVTLGGEPAARYDYVYLSNLGVRRAVVVMCLRNGYIVGVNCDAVEQGYSVYEQAFESLVSSFRFK